MVTKLEIEHRNHSHYLSAVT